MFVVQGVCPTVNSDGTYNIGAPVIVETNEVSHSFAVLSAVMKNNILEVILNDTPSGKLLAVAYGADDEVVACQVKDITEVTDTFDFNGVEATSYKVFAWEDLESIKPLCEPVEAEDLSDTYIYVNPSKESEP